MPLNPINILKRKKVESGQADASQGSPGLISGYRRARNFPGVVASRDAMQKRREKQSAADGVKAHMDGDAGSSGYAQKDSRGESRAASKSDHNAANPSVAGRTAEKGSTSRQDHGSEQGPSSGGASSVQLSPSDIMVPLQIGRYTIGGKLGSGTCGVVHKALDTVLDREVAIKLSPIGEPHLSTGKVPGAQRAYQTEIFAAGRLRHPNIVTVHDAGQYEDLNFLVMESVRGKTLKHYGKGQKLLPLHRALDAIIDCCKALDYSHEQGILHRDIKPANIMIADNESVKLLDFGIAVGLVEDGGLNNKGPTLGTPNYMSPEQILGKPLGPASDFYSLATVLFELVTGKQLFRAKKVKDLFRTVVHEEAPKVSDFRPDLPIEFSQIIEKALLKKPELRYQSGAEMMADLAPFVEEFRSYGSHTPEQLALVNRCSGLDFFQGFAERDVMRVLDEAQVRDVADGSELLEGGNIERRLLVIAEGVVKEYKDGKLKKLFVPGDSLGEMGFVQGNHTDSQFFSATSVRFVELSAAALSELPAELHLRVYKKVSGILVDQVAAGPSSLKLDIQL